MTDRCLFCGDDVSDLGVQVCVNCSNRGQDEPLLKKLSEYQDKLNIAQQHYLLYAKKHVKLRWYQFIQRRYIEKITDMYRKLIFEYTEIINMLKSGLKYNSYKTMGGNAEVEKVEQEFEQITFPLDEN